MKKDYTHISVVLDRSGSMESWKSEVIGGFNDFLDKQKQATGEATLTLTQFDHIYEIVYEAKKIQDCPKLSNESYVPRGMTALLDALGKTIVNTGENLKNMKEEDRPEKVVFLVVTDGQENNSREMKKAKVKEMVEHQQNIYGWQFVFLGANMDAISEGGAIGISAAMSATYDVSKTAQAFAATSANLVSYRSGRAVNMAYTEKQRKEVK